MLPPSKTRKLLDRAIHVFHDDVGAERLNKNFYNQNISQIFQSTWAKLYWKKSLMSSTFKYAEVVASVTSRVKQSNVITAVSVWEGCSYQFELLLIVLIVRYDIFPSYESFPLLHPRKRIQQRAVCFILVGEDPRAASQSQELPECMAT